MNEQMNICTVCDFKFYVASNVQEINMMKG